jgi:hypothetical protein
MHPHGIFCYSVWVNYVSNRRAFPELRHTRLATISNNFVTPVLSDVMMSLGFVPATKEALTYTLKHDQSTGLIIGGAQEAQLNSNVAVRLVLDSRLGFVRVSLEADSPAVIVLHLHENKTYSSPLAISIADINAENKGTGVIDGVKKSIRGVQAWFLKTFKFSIPVFFGRFGTLLPHKISVECTTGDVPIDFRVLFEFYLFLVQNNLSRCFTPQCPLGTMKIPHKHTSNSFKTCYCQMYSAKNIDGTVHQESKENELEEKDTKQQKTKQIKQIVTKIQPTEFEFTVLNTPRELSHSEILNADVFPIEYQIEQATVDDYEEILNKLPLSQKRQILLKKITSAKQKQLGELEKLVDQNDDKNTTLSYQNSLSRFTPQSSPINKPCFLEEELHVPYLTSQHRDLLVELGFNPRDFDKIIKINQRNAHISQLSENSSAPHQTHSVNWTQIPDNIVKWLLLVYIGELSWTYSKYNDDNNTPLEIADFDFVQFCTSQCGLYDAESDIPLDIRSQYRYGVEIGEYLRLYGYNRGLFMKLLSLFLNLKINSTPLSLDGKSGKPYLKDQMINSAAAVAKL